MIGLASLLSAAALVTILAWFTLSIHVLAVQRRRTSAQRILSAVITAFEPRSLSLEDKLQRLRRLAAHASRELIMRAAADRDARDEAFEPLIAYLGQRWGLESLIEDAASHRSSRDKWRRMTALRILARLQHPGTMDLLARAVQESDPDVAVVALALLGSSTDVRAIDVLFDALRAHRHPASRIAVHLDQSPQPIADRLRVLLGDSDPELRQWSATLLARHPGQTTESDLAALTHDPDPRVRKAAIQTLGKIGDLLAADCGFQLLRDSVPYVRAHAARALGELGRADRAEDVASLLGDADWWVRLAAKDSLEMMGTEVWPVLMRAVNDEDQFVRNGAAEVFQNLGVLDSLIVLEAATDNPAAAKIEILRRIAAAGGVRFTESLVERAGPLIGSRIRHLLATIGMQHVGAA